MVRITYQTEERKEGVSIGEKEGQRENDGVVKTRANPKCNGKES